MSSSYEKSKVSALTFMFELFCLEKIRSVSLNYFKVISAHLELFKRQSLVTLNFLLASDWLMKIRL